VAYIRAAPEHPRFPVCPVPCHHQIAVAVVTGLAKVDKIIDVMLTSAIRKFFEVR
jgi:hypothetical protein